MSSPTLPTQGNVIPSPLLDAAFDALGERGFIGGFDCSMQYRRFRRKRDGRMVTFYEPVSVSVTPMERVDAARVAFAEAGLTEENAIQRWRRGTVVVSLHRESA